MVNKVIKPLSTRKQTIMVGLGRKERVTSDFKGKACEVHPDLVPRYPQFFEEFCHHRS